MRFPEMPARPAVAAFGLVWIGVLCGRSGWWPAVLGMGGIVALPRRWRQASVLGLGALAAGTLAGLLSHQRDVSLMAAVMPEGVNSALIVAATDARPSRFGGLWFVGRPVAYQASGATTVGPWVAWRGPPLMINVPSTELSSSPAIEVGRHLQVSGTFRSGPGRAGGTTFAGTVAVTRIEVAAGNANPLLWAGNALRNRVLGLLDRRGPSAALLSGFLVGAIDQLPGADIDAMRLAGLSHYVAVSGANVAGFLLLWFIILGPLGVGGRRRGLLGLPAIAVFAIATRWEPSVVRASLMAGLVLAGRSAGVPVDSWMALGWSGALTLLVAPGLAESLGFQLSVLATAGIMSGGDLLPRSLPRWLRGSLGPTLAAQAAVTPLLLGAFGSVPLLSPLSNLVAAPLVSVVTLLGGLGVIFGFEPLIGIAIAIAGLILDLAHFVAGFPQLSFVAVGLVMAGLVAARSSRLRPLLAIGAALTLVWGGLGTEVAVPPAVVFLDVGQGDASLVLGTDGSTVLIDAGPDPPLLAAALRRYGVGRLDLLVVTHPHEDHIAGMVGLVGRIPIDRVWTGGSAHTGGSWELVAAELALLGVPIETPPVGTVEVHGDILIEVLGPIRRYEDVNDQSVVLRVSAGATDVLMAGDIESVAQADLGEIRPDVLKVPHHGGATSNLTWLAATESRIAVISVGENDYGHPAPEVIDTLSLLGATVLRTDQVGDVVISLIGDPLRQTPVVASVLTP